MLGLFNIVKDPSIDIHRIIMDCFCNGGHFSMCKTIRKGSCGVWSYMCNSALTGLMHVSIGDRTRLYLSLAFIPKDGLAYTNTLATASPITTTPFHRQVIERARGLVSHRVY